MSSQCSINQDISYSGKACVTFKYKGETRGNLELSNEGTDFLLGSIAKALCGENIGDAVPRKLDWVRLVGSTSSSILSSPVNIIGRKFLPRSDTEEASVEISALIRRKDVKLIVAETSQFHLIGTENILASIELTKEDTTNLSEAIFKRGEECLIKWKLTISNKQKTGGQPNE